MALKSRIGFALVVSLFTAGAALVARWTRPERPRGPQVAVAAPVAAAQDVPLPPAAESDARVRAALRNLTPRHLFATWLQQDQLLDRLAVIVVNLADDHSPNRELEFLRPKRGFSAERRGSALVLSPRGAARYDAFASVIGSLDAHAAAAAYRTLHPLLESAFHALGYPGRPLDDEVTRALQRVVDAPAREEVRLERAGALYVYADTSLEALGPVEKQLLRMGARNERLLQSEARDLATALNLPLRGEPQASSR